jgi:REP element-mobilizing transposase RayT
MPRRERVFFEGGFFHVYNRLGRGEHAFRDEETARFFTERLREVTQRDDLAVHAWCLMSNHYHLAVQMRDVPLDRSIKSLQQRTTRFINWKHHVYGPLWQGRFKAKLIDSDTYMTGLLPYIHLNPVSAGLVADPADYPWSGHLDLLGKRKRPIVDVDAVLRVFGKTRRSARAAYVRELNVVEEEEWIGERPGRLPWWRLGRPPKGDQQDPEDAIRRRRKRESQGPDWRPEISEDEFIRRGCLILGFDVDELRSRQRQEKIVIGRELLMVLGVERYNLQVKKLALQLARSSAGMSKALARGIQKRNSDDTFRKKLDELDQRIAHEATKV